MPTGAATPSAPGHRYCPVCGTPTEDRICPNDGTRTVLKQKFAKDALSYEPGDLVNDRYRITGILGRGGFAAVYAAEHTGTGQGIALKMLTLDTTLDEDGEHTQRFFQEARVTAGLTHPNTVRVFDVGQAEGGPLFIAMEMLKGPSLAQYLTDAQNNKQQMSEAAALDIAIPMLKSLGEAHKAGLVHRDIKPANVVLHQGSDDDTIVKLLDFGIARAANSKLTATGLALGTPSYMSPEQCSGQPIDGRSDLYAVGILMFLCVTGKLPFAGDDSMAVMFMQVNAPMPNPRSLASHELSDGFVKALSRAMHKQPERRFATAREMRIALEAVRGGAWGGTPVFGLDTETALRTVGAATASRAAGEHAEETDPEDEETRATDTIGVAGARSGAVSGAVPAGLAEQGDDATIATSVTPARVLVGQANAGAGAGVGATAAMDNGPAAETVAIETSAGSASLAAVTEPAPSGVVTDTAKTAALSADGTTTSQALSATSKSGINPTMIMAAMSLVVAVVAVAVVLQSTNRKPTAAAPVVALPPTAAEIAAAEQEEAAKRAVEARDTAAQKAAAAQAAAQANAEMKRQAEHEAMLKADIDVAVRMSHGATSLAKQIEYAAKAVKLAPDNADYKKYLDELHAKRKHIVANRRKVHAPRKKTVSKPKPAKKDPDMGLAPAFAD